MDTEIGSSVPTYMYENYQCGIYYMEREIMLLTTFY